MKQKLWAAARVLLVGAILFFVGWFVYRDWHELSTMHFEFHPWPFVLSLPLVLAFYFQQATVWWVILIGVSKPKPMPWREGMAIWFASQVAKYVPGKVMLPLMRFGLCKRRGIDIGRVTLAIYLELSLMTGSIILVSLLTAIGWSGAIWDSLAESMHWPGAGSSLRWVTLLLVPATLVAVHPRLLQWVINLGLRLIKKEPVKVDVTYLKMLTLGVFCIAGWIVYAYACWLIAVSLGFGDADAMLRVAGAFLLSWVIGFLSFVTPGGVGVREVVLIALLKTAGMTLGAAAAASVLCRLQWTGVELIGAALTVRHTPKEAPARAPAGDVA
jgi:uncharacterized membrane protein YbhN (UPF0104 family)